MRANTKKTSYATMTICLLCIMAVLAGFAQPVHALTGPSLSDHVLQDTVTPSGIVLNLFDYWVTENRTDSDTETPYSSYKDGGINNGHSLKFNSQGPGSGSINDWTRSEAPYSGGIVQPQLVGGYPMLIEGLNYGAANESNAKVGKNESLAYLFDSSEQTGKKAFFNVQGLMRVDDNGYYYYNADQKKADSGSYGSANYAFFDETTNSFKVYDTWGVIANGGSTNPPNGQFFPFTNPASTSIFNINNRGQMTQNRSMNSGSSALNHYFGITMTTRFVQRYEGKTDKDASKAKNMTFEFAGDDDVWLFIDGVLVCDLSGIHNQATTSINFATGDIKINGEPAGTIREKLQPYYTDTSYYRGDTLADDTYHTMKLFYLERGGMDSNLAMRFNLAHVPETDGYKVDQFGNALQGVEFTLYAATKNEEDGTYAVDESKGVNEDGVLGHGVTDANGRFVLNDHDQAVISLNQLKLQGIRYLLLRETSDRTGYRPEQDIYLEIEDRGTDTLLLNDLTHQWQTGTNVLAKNAVYSNPNIQLRDASGASSGSANLEEQGVMFGVVMRRLEGVGYWEPRRDDSWGVVTGNALEGWNVTQVENKGDSYIGTVLRAVQGHSENYAVFQPASNGSYMAELSNCPGDIRDYYFWYESDDGGNDGASEAQLKSVAYSVAYYYTTADSVEQATTENTFWVASTNFERQFAGSIYIPNIKNFLYVQKVDDLGNAVGGAEFSLFRKADIVFDEDGNAVSIQDDAEAYDTVTTDAEGSASFPSDGHMLATGEYYLAETQAPDGYTVNPTLVHVIANEKGVLADAGTEDDGITVSLYEGRLVRTMAPYATEDDLDRTLMDILAVRMDGVYNEETGELELTENEDVSSELVFDEELYQTSNHQILSYRPSGGDPHTEWVTDTGWIWFKMTQEYHGLLTGVSGNANKINLGDTDLTRLFTGETTVIVTDQRVGTLEVSKTVRKAEDSETEPDLTKQYRFQLTLTKTEEDGDTPFTGTVRTKDQTGAEGTLTFDARGTAGFWLKDGESIKLLDLPMGTNWSVTELSEDSLIEQWTTTVDGAASDTAEGTIAQAGQNDQANFVNIYGSYTPESSVLSGETDLKITKQYEENKAYDGDVTFTIAGLSGAPMPSHTSVTVSGADTVSFGDITYTEPGTYRYTIAETQVNLDGMTWDGTVYTVTVSVRENRDEKKLKIESVSYVSSKEEDFTYGEDGMIFTNAYEEPVTTGTLTISKVVRTAPDSEEDVDLTRAYNFSIQLTQADGTAFTGTVRTEDAQGEEGELAFTDGEASASLMHGETLKLLELPDGAAWRVTEQSANARFVQWTTTVNGARSNTAGGTIAAGQEARANFVNIFGSYTSKSVTLSGSTDLKITKRYDEAGDSYSGKVYFTIEAVDDAPLPAVTTVPVTGADAVSFGDIVFEEAGTYQYTIREKSASIEGMTQDDAVYTVSVTVTEDQDARQLVIESVEYASSADEAFAYGEDGMVFTNRYEKPEETTGALKISKTIGGKGADEDAAFRFRIKIKDLEGEYDGVTFENGTATVKIQAGDSLKICDLPAGLSYSVKELNSSGYKVTYENEKGTILAGETIEVSIHNEKTSSSGGSSGGGTPSLNTKDHYAYIIGYEDGTVQPNGNITRAEVATIFFRLLRDEVRTEYWSQTNSYSDVAATDWFNNAVSTLSKMGIISGYPDGSFRPNAPITRAELTKIAAGFFADDRVTKAYDGRFSDVSGSEWYSEALMKAIEEGLIYGYPDGTFGPNRFITRAETCTIVNRTLGRGPHKDHLLPTQQMIVWPDNRRTSAWYYAQMQEATNSHDYTWTTDAGETVESWTGKLEERDWAALERTWSNANSAPGGEVMQ